MVVGTKKNRPSGGTETGMSDERKKGSAMSAPEIPEERDTYYSAYGFGGEE
jgi:hypothetical protein